MTKVECKKSRHHGFYVDTEGCPWCAPAPEAPPPDPEEDLLSGFCLPDFVNAMVWALDPDEDT
jgi:DNA-binding helix-hairpin-helix protein with protein kinase domain